MCQKSSNRDKKKACCILQLMTVVQMDSRVYTCLWIFGLIVCCVNQVCFETSCEKKKKSGYQQIYQMIMVKCISHVMCCFHGLSITAYNVIRNVAFAFCSLCWFFFFKNIVQGVMHVSNLHIKIQRVYVIMMFVFCDIHGFWHFLMKLSLF